jgi:hypothetical protein
MPAAGRWLTRPADECISAGKTLFESKEARFESVIREARGNNSSPKSYDSKNDFILDIPADSRKQASHNPLVNR